MAFIAISLVFTAIAAIAAHRSPDTGIQWWFPLIALPGQMPLLIEQRRLTEVEWRRREAENDERHQMIAGKAAPAVCGVLCARKNLPPRREIFY